MVNSLRKNIEMLQEIFHFPQNQDFIFRELYIKSLKKQGVVLWIDGIVNEDMLQDHILQPLMEVDTGLKEKVDIIDSIATIHSGEKIIELEIVVDHIIQGKTILLIEGYDKAISFNTTKYEHRDIDKTTVENVIKGPQEAFIESGKVNRALIRKQIKNENLITESIKIGKRANKYVYVMYIKDLANEEIVGKVKERIIQIDTDTIATISVLEQHIEERPYSLVPTILTTERPDRAAAFLQEGHVILIMDNASPHCLIAPATFWSFFHTAEDTYQRWIYGNFIRFIRLIACIVALLAPAIYLSATNYHVEMIPTDLLLAIGATRETVPFPVILEIGMMEMAFELLREAGVRIPTPIGPTIGIVGALILGQAAVEANMVSPILVIVIAITGLASFAIPDNNLSSMVRIGRFLFLGLAATMGLLGVASGLVMGVAYLVSVESFGVSFLAPMMPYYPSSKDMLFRPPVWKQWIRPQHVHPKDRIRRKKG